MVGRTLAPTTNTRMPFGGLDRLRWDNLLSDKLHSHGGSPLVSLIQDLCNATGKNFSASHLLSIAAESVTHVRPEIFDCLFSLVKNRCRKEWGFAPQ